MLPWPASGVLLLGFAVAFGAVVAMVEVADGAGRAVEVALLAAVPDGGWGVRTPPMPTTPTTTPTPTPAIMVTTAVLRFGIRAGRRKGRRVGL